MHAEQPAQTFGGPTGVSRLVEESNARLMAALERMQATNAAQVTA
jgi:hypothetical protein